MLPREIFENPPGKEQVEAEGQVFYVINEVRFDDGIQLFINGAEYYQRGMAMGETLFFVNMAKRLLVEGLKLGSKLPILIGLMTMFVRTRKARLNFMEGIIESFNSLMYKILSPYILKPQYMTPSARQLRSVVKDFMLGFGMSERISTQFSDIFSHMIEYDNAYRFRMQDMFTSTSKNDIVRSPIRTINKMVQTLIERDTVGVSVKFKAGVRFLSMVLLFPSFRNAFKSAFLKSDFEKLQFDEIDIYWISMRNDYDYLGETVDVRSLRNTGKSIPAPVPKEEYDRLKAVSENKQ